MIRAAVGAESAVGRWEAAVDRLLADSKRARAAGQLALAEKAERAATSLYLARCAEYEDWRETASPPKDEGSRGYVSGVGQFSRRAAHGQRSAAFPAARPYRRPVAPYLAAPNRQAEQVPTARQLVARAAFRSRFATAR
jgi:hypothetical protein